jgi:hypothetical protein
MSLPSQTTVQNLSRPYKAPTWFPKGLLDQFVRKVPFEHVAEPSPTTEWNRATSLPVISVYTRGGTFSAAAMDTTKVTGNWFRVGEVAEVDYFDQTAASNTIEQLAVQVGARKVGCVRALGLGIVEGAGGPASRGSSSTSPPARPSARPTGPPTAARRRSRTCTNWSTSFRRRTAASAPARIAWWRRPKP